MAASNRGRKRTPNAGVTAVIPCRIREVMGNSGKTQFALAEEMSADFGMARFLGKDKISRATISMLVAGRMLPSIRLLTALCYFFKCKPTDLYEPYILAAIGEEKRESWIKEGGYWSDTRVDEAVPGSPD